MERLKTNKAALFLFIATIAMLVIYIISIITTTTSLEAVEKITREEAVRQGLNFDQAEQAVSLVRGMLIAVLVLSGIFELFAVLCGLKCSLQGKWRTGAIVFGVLLLIGGIFSISNAKGVAASIVVSVIDFALVVTYFVGAILCKPDTYTKETLE